MSQKASIIEALPEDLREAIEQDVQAGDFADADEAIRKAILSQHERIALRRSLVEAEAQIDRGEFFTPEQSRARTHALAAKYRKQ
jgi:Arc/MetJ-type ribon-helix-helix transcriptional regulator